jgi:hypothetical protein
MLNFRADGNLTGFQGQAKSVINYYYRKGAQPMCTLGGKIEFFCMDFWAWSLQTCRYLKRIE